MAKIDDIDVPSLTWPEAAAPSTPASGKVITYAKSDGLMYSKDDAGTETLMSGGGGSGGVATDSIWDAAGDIVQGTGANTAARLALGTAGHVLTSTGSAVAWQSRGGYDINEYTGGDIALTSTSPAAVSGPTDLVVAAATGDLLMVGIGIVPVTNTAASIGFDFASIVSASPVNYLSSQNGTPLTVGCSAWFIGSSITSGAGGVVPYVVQAGDLSGGNITLRLYARVSANRSINADASTPLVTWVRNLRQ